MQAKSRTTLIDVATAVGVSPKTVSRVIHGQPGIAEDTRLRINEAIQRLGYVPNPAARRLRGLSTGIALIVSGFEDYTGQVVRGISLTAQKLGYDVVLYVQFEPEGDTDPYLQLLNSGMIGGVMMVVPYDYDILIKVCEQRRLPYVLVDYQGSTPSENVPTVTVANRKATMDAMRYLLALGHKRIAFITGLLSMGSAQERLQGYRDALTEVGIAYDPALVLEGSWSEASGYERTQQFLKLQPPPTAIVASDDLTAFGAIDAIKDAGLRVGEDVSVIGFDDIPMAATNHPSLTTIRQPMPEMGQAAVDLLVGLLQGIRPVNVHREFGTELIVRESTGKPKQA